MKSKKKKRTWKERGEWPTTSASTKEMSIEKLAADEAEARAVAAEAEAAELRKQLKFELAKTVNMLVEQEREIGVERSERKKRERKTKEREKQFENLEMEVDLKYTCLSRR